MRFLVCEHTATPRIKLLLKIWIETVEMTSSSLTRVKTRTEWQVQDAAGPFDLAKDQLYGTSPHRTSRPLAFRFKVTRPEDGNSYVFPNVGKKSSKFCANLFTKSEYYFEHRVSVCFVKMPSTQKTTILRRCYFKSKTQFHNRCGMQLQNHKQVRCHLQQPRDAFYVSFLKCILMCPLHRMGELQHLGTKF